MPPKAEEPSIVIKADSCVCCGSNCVKSSKNSTTMRWNIFEAMAARARLIRRKAYTAPVSPNMRAKALYNLTFIVLGS